MTKLILISDHIKNFLIPAFERKTESIVAIDVRGLTSYTDTLIIIEATSKRQVSAISEHIVTDLKKKNIYSIGTEGIQEGEWVLLDYGDVIIHIFESDIKTYYNLEGLWADAPRYELSEVGVRS
jgi:ribosome-associated protein